MQVEVVHDDDFSEIEGEPYHVEVSDDADLQEIWDIVVNCGDKTDELTDWGMQIAEEGIIYFDDNNESSAGHRVQITWEARVHS
jgi:hypothetical protein